MQSKTLFLLTILAVAGVVHALKMNSAAVSHEISYTTTESPVFGRVHPSQQSFILSGQDLENLSLRRFELGCGSSVDRIRLLFSNKQQTSWLQGPTVGSSTGASTIININDNDAQIQAWFYTHGDNRLSGLRIQTPSQNVMCGQTTNNVNHFVIPSNKRIVGYTASGGVLVDSIQLKLAEPNIILETSRTFGRVHPNLQSYNPVGTNIIPDLRLRRFELGCGNSIDRIRLVFSNKQRTRWIQGPTVGSSTGAPVTVTISDSDSWIGVWFYTHDDNRLSGIHIQTPSQNIMCGQYTNHATYQFIPSTKQVVGYTASGGSLVDSISFIYAI